MITPEEALEFCSKHYRKNGRPFSIKGREWVRDELFEPALSWKLWPRDKEDLCGECAKEVGTLVQWSPELVKKYAEKPDCCSGIVLKKIMMVVLNLQRGAGKTTNTCALITALLVKEPQVRASFLASAGQQAQTIFRENILQAVQSSKALSRRFSMERKKLLFDRAHDMTSFVEVLDSSASSAAGRRRNFLFFDEGRDIHADVFVHMLPSIKAGSLLACPNRGAKKVGHHSKPYRPHVIEYCDDCGTVLEPSIPVTIITSTSGVRSGGARDWFDEMVEMLAAKEEGIAHLYRSADASNPDASEVETELLKLVGNVPVLSERMGAEIDNIPIIQGEGLVTPAEISQCIHPAAKQTYVSDLPTLGFLDTSTVGDLTSLVLVSEDPDSKKPWEIIRLSHVFYWRPSEVEGGVITEHTVIPYLTQVLPGFSNLVEVRIDTRGMRGATLRSRENMAQKEWPYRLLDMLDEHQAPKELCQLRTKIHGFSGLFDTHEVQKQRSAAWTQFDQRIRSNTIRLFPHQILERELRGLAKKHTSSGLLEVKDKARKQSHADIAEGLAMCCYMAWKLGRDDIIEGYSDLVMQLGTDGGTFDEMDFY